MSILTQCQQGVVTIQLNRTHVLNALNTDVMHSIVREMTTFDQDPNVGCFVLTGSERSFSAGADIKELADHTYMDMLNKDFMAIWDQFDSLHTPKIAAVSGYALGGGCELAMMCDMVFAADTAQFGQPEIKLGLIPGMGGTQRLPQWVGKAKAMDMILTGEMIDATEAEQIGLVSRVFPADKLMAETLKIATKIASYSKTAAIAARQTVNYGLAFGLASGIHFERQRYYALWATSDAQKGMANFKSSAQ